jgi:hypothetical protein
VNIAVTIRREAFIGREAECHRHSWSAAGRISLAGEKGAAFCLARAQVRCRGDGCLTELAEQEQLIEKRTVFCFSKAKHRVLSRRLCWARIVGPMLDFKLSRHI